MFILLPFFFLSLFLAAPGLCWCTAVFSDCAEWDCCLAAVLRLVIAVAPPAAERRLLGLTGFVAPRHLGSSWTRDRTHIPLHGQAGSQPLGHQGSP